MTPAPISVERLREVVAIVNGPLLSCKANDHAAWEAVSFLQDQGLALLHQLAERDAEVERLEHRITWCMSDIDAAQNRARAAERAREEAMGLLHRVHTSLYLLDKPHREFGGVTDKTDRDIAAFLAASGGK